MLSRYDQWRLTAPDDDPLTAEYPDEDPEPYDEETDADEPPDRGTVEV